MMFTTFIRRAFVVLLLAGATAGTRAAEPAPSTSLCQSGVALTDQNGRIFYLADLRSEPVLVSMFYTSYQVVCPVIFEITRATLVRGGKPMHDGARVLMMMVNPERDSITALKKTASVYDADDHWQVARTNTNGAHEVAALLDIQHRHLTDGDFNHSSTILLLDTEECINARTNTLGTVDLRLMGAMHKLVATRR